MPLRPGSRLGGYEILALIGSGGMGEVYRAHDTKLGRDVALKILPEAFALDAERIARFKREAQVLASLNHPNIGPIYGFEDADGVHALVLELVDGPTLADRIAHGPIPLDEALPIAKKIAQALEAAHEQGIVHRDLKPANIKLRPDGAVKVLDFGLAKIIESPAPSGGASASLSPTITSPAMTALGVILGTAAYMSPEQARGRPADKRSDIWAFGCALYEMLTGKRAFEGDDVGDTLATVLKSEPDWKALAPSTPVPIRELVRQCLRKDANRRLQAIGDARIQIDDVIRNEPEDTVRSENGYERSLPRWRRPIPIAAAAILAGGLGIVAGYGMRPSTSPAIVTRFTYRLPDGQVFTNIGRHYVAISPDGTTIVYVANRRLYKKTMADIEATPIAGTDLPQGVTTPVFAPDGQWIVFYSDNALRKIATSGGAAVTLCQADNPFGVSWDEDTILFGQGRKGIMRVSANGGSPEVLVRVKDREFATSPQMLPGRRSILYTVVGADLDWENAQIVVETLGSTERKTIRTGSSDARYVPTGHIVYALGGVLLAAPFDVQRLEITGGPVPVVEGVASPRAGAANPGTGAAQFFFSRTGSLAYIAGPVTATSNPVQLDIGSLDRSGAVERWKLPPRSYYAPRMSPDGRQLAVGIDDGKEADIWVYDLSGTSALRRLTFGGKNRFPIWTPDSERVAFQSDREGDRAIFSQRADGTGGAERLTKAEPGQMHVPDAWSSKTDLFLFDVRNAEGFSLWTFLVKEKKAAPFDAVRSEGVQPGGMFSPDGQWVTYASANASDQRSGIYVQPFPPTGAKFLIDTGRNGAATNPFWSRDGKELYYSQGAGATFSVVSVRAEPTFSFGNATSVPRPGIVGTTPGLARNYDIAPDGKHFVVVVDSNGATSPAVRTPQIEVVLNWFTELKQRVPTR